ncbi:MAG: lamin tail domain-containing protein [bacterium]|nr:lamin tail domain-containing protein [bacterium]
MWPWETESGRAWLLLNVALLLLLGGVWADGARGAVLLSEVLADPASDWNGDGTLSSRDDEWIEVVNTGPDSVDLADYWLRDALGEEAQLRLSGALAAGGTALFTGDAAVSWQQAQGMTVTGLSLNNGGDELGLYRGDPALPGATLVDALIYPAHAGVDDRALARMLPENEWVLCDALAPYGGALLPAGTGCPPTPGAWNACEGLVPAQERSWGEIKVDYR